MATAMNRSAFKPVRSLICHGVHNTDSNYFFSWGADRVVVFAVHCAALLHGAERGGGACGGGVDDGGDVNNEVHNKYTDYHNVSFLNCFCTCA